MSAGEKPCPSCGHPNTPDALFCSKCGADIAKAAAPAAAPPPPESQPPSETARGPARTVVGMAMPDVAGILRNAGLDVTARAESSPEAPARPDVTQADDSPVAETPGPALPSARAAAPTPPVGSAMAKEMARAASVARGQPAPSAPAQPSPVSPSPVEAPRPEAKRHEQASFPATTGHPTAVALSKEAPTGQPEPEATPAREPSDEAAPAARRPRRARAAKTMVGMPAPRVPVEAPVAAPVEAPVAAPVEAPVAAPPSEARRAPFPETTERAVAKAPKEKAPPPEPAAPVGSASTSAPAKDAASTPTGGDDALAPPARRRELGPSQRTILGQPAPAAAVEAAVARAAAKAAPPSEPAANAERSADASSGVSAPAGSSYADDSDASYDALPTRRPGKGLLVAVLALGGLFALAGGGALIYWALTDSKNLDAEVRQGEQGEELVVEVPGAPEGARARFRGEERALEGGRVAFPLSAEDLSLGENVLNVDVVDSGGSVTSHRVVLSVDLRVRADLGPLASMPPAIDVVVEAPAGSTASLDGDALALDANGRGRRRFPIRESTPNAEGVVELVVRYQVEPPEGEVAQGALRTRIPVTSLQIDRPGTRIVTDRERVEIAGATASGATVTVDGEEVEVEREGRFLHRLTLSEMGERSVEVIARAAGRAPRIETIEIRRVPDLAAEANRFEADPTLGWARLSQSPNVYRGQRVAFVGVAYNVDVSGGRSVLQILVEPCPAGERCPLWVTYPAATDIEVRDRVRVLGTVAGVQQFRSQSGEVRTVPRVDATFVLPAPATGRR